MMVKSLLPLGLLLILGTPGSAEEIKPKLILKLDRNTDAPELAYSPDGKTLALAVHRIPTTSSLLWEAPGAICDLLFKRSRPPEKGAVKLLDATSGKETASLSVSGECRSLAFSPDGKVLALGGWDHVRLWSLGRGKPMERATLKVPSTHGSVHSLSFSPDGKILAVAPDTVMLCDLESTERHELITKEGTHRVLFSPDGKTLVTQSTLLPAEPFKNWKDWKYVIKVWDVASKKEKAMLETSFLGGGAVGFTPDSKFLAYADPIVGEKGAKDFESQVKLWNLSTRKEQSAFKGHPGMADALAFTSDGKLLAVGCGSGTIKVWDVATGKEVATLKGPGGAVNVVAFSPDGKTLASSYAGHAEVRLWDVPQLLRQKKDK